MSTYSQEEDTNTTTTKQTLQQDVHSSIAKLLQHRQTNNSDIAIDVYRAIQHESYLLVERQLILDALDNDPFGLMKKVDDENNDEQSSDVGSDNDDDDDGYNTEDKTVNKDIEAFINEINPEKQKNTELITRIKSMLRVISCTRTTTIDGYSSIHAVVQFDNDGSMDKNVKNHVRLHFTFLREPQNDSMDTTVDNSVDISSADVEVEEDKKGCCSSSNKFDTPKTNGECSSGSTKAVVDEYQPAKKRKRITKDDDSTAQKDEDEAINDSQSDDENDNASNYKGGLSPKTIVTYKIDYSIDYGKQHQLLGVDIYALGKYPSVEEAVPMFDDDDIVDNDDQLEEEDGDDNDEDDNMNKSVDEDTTKLTSMKQTENDKKQSTANGEEFEDIVMSDDDDAIGNDRCNNKGSCCNEADTTNNDNENENDGGDRFGVHINPENVVSFLDHMNINFNEQSVFYFLLTFPFYEHEWDISGFLLTALFDDEGDYEDEEEQMMNGDNVCESECPLPCCVPCNA